MLIELNSDNAKETAVKTAEVLNSGGLCILPTDTIYGFICRADADDAIERIYKIKGRERDKPFLVLLADIKSISGFSDMEMPQKLKPHIPGPLTFIMPLKTVLSFSFCRDTLAIRIPDDTFLLDVLSQTSAVVAPSANKAGKAPSMKINEIADEFESDVDLIVSAGDIKESLPSTIYDCVNEKVLREGALKL